MHNQPGGAPPVFVDRTGRRRRLTVIAGTAMGLGLLTSLALILAGLFVDSSVTVPGWSDDRAPVEAEVEGRDDVGRTSPRPDPATSTSAPLPAATRSAAPGTSASTAAPGPRPTSSDQPGQGDDRRNSPKPSRSPGKPG
ncbi:hypothetical protein HCJ94_04775 [Micromonospora sp. HSS6-12]|uniref:Uncharacterized protein n=2 Tax=Micromonospora thermarum TaxID=2720024 RepID=A0ABX0Z0M7_9ACTN|nr:hypothetical protein [Micromonospora thermarum]